MKRAVLALTLALSLCLTGCAGMLERSYSSSTAHVDKPAVAEDPSVLRVEDYRQLVSAVLYLVSRREEQGVIQLRDYDGPVEADLAAACAEVADQDPLGAYCVDRIEHEYTQVVSYYQATVSIRYRRTQEQMESIVSVTGAGAIRDQLQEALARFAPEVVLRVAYCSEDADSIAQLVRQAYCEAPATALGLPQAEVSIYPDSGLERVVEIVLTYPESETVLREKAAAVEEALGELPPPGKESGEAEAAAECARMLRDRAVYDAEADATVYAALVEGRADSEGFALAYTLLCRRRGLACEAVEGTVNGEGRMWNAVTLSGGERLYLDPSAPEGGLYSAQQFYDAGYRWSAQPRQDGDMAQPEDNPAQ